MINTFISLYSFVVRSACLLPRDRNYQRRNIFRTADDRLGPLDRNTSLHDD